MSAMRCIFLVAGMIAGLAGQAQAFDGAPRPGPTIAPGKEVTPLEALRNGARQYYSGDKAAALTSLQYAAQNGQSRAAWKLGKMYETGDGVEEDDLKAFEYYSQVVREHGDDRPDGPDAPFVASAFVSLGSYYLKGINGAVPQSLSRARQIFTHAASYFGDPQAQYELGRLYQKSSYRMAVRWFNLAALKGHVGAQALLGETLYENAQSDRRKARGLMWLNIAQRQAKGAEDDWILTMHEQYFARSNETIRRQAHAMTEAWLKNNRPDLVTQTAATQ